MLNKTSLKFETFQFSVCERDRTCRNGVSDWREALRSFTNPLIGTYARGDAYAHIYAPLPLAWRGLVHTSVILAARA